MTGLEVDVGHSCAELWIMESPIVIAGLRFGCVNTLQFLVLCVVFLRSFERFFKMRLPECNFFGN